MNYETRTEARLWFSDSTNTLLLVPGKFGSIGEYTKSPGIYKCPSDKSWILLEGNRYQRVRKRKRVSSLNGSVLDIGNSYPAQITQQNHHQVAGVERLQR